MLQLRNSLVVCAIVLGTAMGLQANTAPVDPPRPPRACPTTGNFDTLEDVGRCTIGDKTFSGFRFTSSGAHPFDSDDLDYSTINHGTEAIGFSFSGPIHAGHNQASLVEINYEVSGPGIIDAQAAISGHGTGFGHGVMAENLCLGGPFHGCPANDLRSLVVTTLGHPSATITFSPVPEIGVSKSVAAFGSTGSFEITNFSQTFSQVPEPGTMLLFGTGLFLIGTLGRKLLHA